MLSTDDCTENSVNFKLTWNLSSKEMPLILPHIYLFINYSFYFRKGGFECLLITDGYTNIDRIIFEIPLCSVKIFAYFGFLVLETHLLWLWVNARNVRFRKIFTLCLFTLITQLMNQIIRNIPWLGLFVFCQTKPFFFRPEWHHNYLTTNKPFVIPTTL